ncbi:histidine kinase-, DNA gyrase B-, and HSP90-like ATPase family protein [[Clostridium] sordellii ATCC 9714]|nr:histidine kinase-, DNA gyrase B-, and HSP90-like ATPase family protein [[Clostridium] sordellii ATCC 9714] [Paeniclostridium sordellii ATCC 9714]
MELKESNLDHLFERFYTVDKSRNRSGSGLGLYIVKLLLKKIGGEVRDISLEDGILSISIMFKAFVELDKEL